MDLSWTHSLLVLRSGASKVADRSTVPALSICLRFVDLPAAEGTHERELSESRSALQDVVSGVRSVGAPDRLDPRSAPAIRARTCRSSKRAPHARPEITCSIRTKRLLWQRGQDGGPVDIGLLG